MPPYVKVVPDSEANEIRSAVQEENLTLPDFESRGPRPRRPFAGWEQDSRIPGRAGLSSLHQFGSVAAAHCGALRKLMSNGVCGPLP